MASSPGTQKASIETVAWLCIQQMAPAVLVAAGMHQGALRLRGLLRASGVTLEEAANAAREEAQWAETQYAAAEENGDSKDIAAALDRAAKVCHNVADCAQAAHFELEAEARSAASAAQYWATPVIFLPEVG